MTTNVILPDLLTFNQRVLSELQVPTKSVTLVLKNGLRFEASPSEEQLRDAHEAARGLAVRIEVLAAGTVLIESEPR